MEDIKKSETSPNNKVIDLKPMNRDESKSVHSKFGQYKPNEELLQATARIKKQRDVIQDRINAMNEASMRVSRGVFDKVKRDYLLQLQTITELLDEKKEGLKKEIKDLYLRREKLSVEINRHREILEEAEFRHYLGEFSQTQFQEVENYETKEIEKLESDMSLIAEYIRQHEDLFDPVDLSTPNKNSNRQRDDITKTLYKENPPAKKEPNQAQASNQASMKQALDESIQQHPSNETESDDNHFQASDFEDLFLDDESEKIQSKIEESQHNIQKIITEENSQSSSTQEKTRQTQSDADYFKQEKVTESSYNLVDDSSLNNMEFDPDSEKTPTATKIKTDTDVTVPKMTKEETFSKDDSISEILDSIKIEDDQKEEPIAEPTDVPIKNNSAKSEYILKLIEGDHETKQFVLKDNTSIGRSPSNDVTLKAPKVSRQHAAINVYNNQYIIIDLKSSNGVYVNGTKIDECILAPNDEISIGGYKFLFEKAK